MQKQLFNSNNYAVKLYCNALVVFFIQY
jgi:hypothetical protein